jgi:ABC-type branched-subunit amino acid transport system substrate-binding protein
MRYLSRNWLLGCALILGACNNLMTTGLNSPSGARAQTSLPQAPDEAYKVRILRDQRSPPRAVAKPQIVAPGELLPGEVREPVGVSEEGARTGSLTSPENQDDRYAAPQPPPAAEGVPRVAILLPLTGPSAKLGQAMLNAAQLALFHFANKEFELLPQDTHGTAAGAETAMALAIGDGAELVLGPLYAHSVEAVAPAARAAGVTVIAFSNDRRVAGDGVFTMGFLPSEQVRRVVQFAADKGLRRFALLAPNNHFGTAITDALTEAAAESDAEVTQVEYYDPDATDFAPVIKRLGHYNARRQNLLHQRRILRNRGDEVARQALRRLKNRQTLGDVPFDALLIADGGKRLQAIAALLPYYDIDPKKTRMLGTGQWDVGSNIAGGVGAEPALVGAWFAAPSERDRTGFVKQYTEIYGVKPPRIATLAYDATAIAAVFAQDDGKFDLSEITTPQGFTGRDGIFRFNPDGVTERGLSIHQVLERGAKIIEAPPKSFEDAID